MHLHGTLGAKFLATEAGNALFLVDDGDPVFHLDCFGRADLGAFAASDTFLLLRDWRCL